MATAGDIIHNLRSALDHLAHQLVWVGSGHAPTRQVEFPISKDMASYERDKARKVEGMSVAAVKAIDALKPYHGGNAALWRILELDNTDKHRTIFTIGQDTLFTADWIDAPFPEYLVKAGDPHFTGVFDSAVEREVNLRISESLGNPQIPQGDSLLPTLHQLVDVVENLVLSFEPLLK